MEELDSLQVTKLTYMNNINSIFDYIIHLRKEDGRKVSIIYRYIIFKWCSWPFSSHLALAS